MITTRLQTQYSHVCHMMASSWPLFSPPRGPRAHCLTCTSLNPSQHPHERSKHRRQIFEELGIEYSYPAQVSRSTLLDEAAVPSEPCKPRLLTVDEACAHQEAKHSMHHGQAGLMRTVEVEGVTYFIRNDVVCSNALVESSAAPKAASTAQALGPEPSCAPASPAVMKPKSYAAVAKALVVTAARAQPAAVPLKPSGATPQFAADNPAEAEAAKPRINAKVVANVVASKVRHCLEYPTSIYPSIHLSVYLSSYPSTFLSYF